jgi:hypothetical protein
VIGDPQPAVGDAAGGVFGVPDGGYRVEEVADQSRQAPAMRVYHPVRRIHPAVVVGLPSMLPSGGLGLVGAGLAGQQHQGGQHGQGQQARGGDREGAQDR